MCLQMQCYCRRRILHTTKGYPAQWNDKTIIKFDTFASGLQKGCILDDVEFKLLKKTVMVMLLKLPTKAYGYLLTMDTLRGQQPFHHMHKWCRCLNKLG